MKITTELLKKYALNACTAQEREAVDRWLADTDSDVPHISDEQWERANALMKMDIAKHVGTHHKTIVPMHKKWMRYAVAACVAAAIFFVGRYSANEGTSAIAQQSTEQESNNLLVYGGNGAYAKIPGNEFSLQFDGRLKLYNGSKESKTVTVGNQTYTLKPRQIYILTGNNEKSSLVADLDLKLERVGLDKPVGDFGIRVIKA